MNALALLVVVLFMGAPSSTVAVAAGQEISLRLSEMPVARGDEVGEAAVKGRASDPAQRSVAVATPRWKTVRGWGRPAPRAPDA